MISLSDYAATSLLSVVAVFYAAALYNSLLGCLMNFFFVICYLLWIIFFSLRTRDQESSQMISTY